MINELFGIGDIAVRVAVGEVFFTILVSFILGLLITTVYIKTYRGRFYSQTFAHTLIIVSVVIAIVIVVIGSNIARAFSLAGALSIIRFRSSIRDPRDVAFIFFAMASGLAAGTGLFLPAIVFVVVLSAIIYLLYSINYGDRRITQKILKITLPENLNYEGLFDDIFQEYLDDYSFISVRTINLGTMFELAYSIQMAKDVSDKTLIDDIRARNGNLNVTILLDHQQMMD